MNRGDAVYTRLMDLALTLQDINAMGPLRMFLGALKDDTPALRKLSAEVEAFSARIDSLVTASRGAKL